MPAYDFPDLKDGDRWSLCSLRWMEALKAMDGIGRRLAGEGFVVFSAAYRLAPESRYPAQLEDVRDAFRWLAARNEVDPTRMAAWGYSAGAQLALLLGLNPVPGQPRPNAIVAGGTPAVFGLFDPQSRLLVNYLGASRAAAPERWAEASPIEWVSSDDPSIYLYHGQTDQLVDIEHARRLASALAKVGVAVTLDEVRGGHLGVFLNGRDTEVRAAATTWAAIPARYRLPTSSARWMNGWNTRAAQPTETGAMTCGHLRHAACGTISASRFLILSTESRCRIWSSAVA